MVGRRVWEGLGSYARRIVWFLVRFVISGWLVNWGWFRSSYGYGHISEYTTIAFPKYYD